MTQQLITPLGKVFFEMQYDPEENWIYANWIGYISVENVQKGALAVLAEMEKHNCNALLNDNREVLGPWIKANEWLESFWMPKADVQGLNYMAWVLGPGIAAALSAQDMQGRTNGYFEMKLFGEIEKAKIWLRGNRLAP